MRPSESLASLSDLFEQSASSITGLTTVLPDWAIEEAIAQNGREGMRKRKLVPLSVVWLVVGMSLFRDLNVKNVLHKLVQDLGLSVNWGLAEVPHQTSITAARDRVGWETVRTLYFKHVGMLVERSPEVDDWRGLPTYALDGSGFPTPDTPANEAEFGRPKTGRGQSAFPQFRGVLLVGAWSHYVLGALFAAWTVGELTLARSMLGQIPKRSLVLQDRNFYAYTWLGDLAERGTSFVVRAKRRAKKKTKKKATKKKAKIRVKDLQMVRTTKRISRYEWLGVLEPSRAARRERPDLPGKIPVRVIKCTRRGAQPIFLVTNLLDREEYPTQEVADLYRDRWEVETGLREVKCAVGANGKSIFRSKKPDRVRQETYGLLIAYNCVRALMADAAEVAGVRPRQLSLTDCLLLTRTMFVHMAQADPEELPRLHDTLIDQMARCVLPDRRRGRSCPREVKQKMSNYRRKRPAKLGRSDR